MCRLAISSLLNIILQLMTINMTNENTQLQNCIRNAIEKSTIGNSFLKTFLLTVKDNRLRSMIALLIRNSNNTNDKNIRRLHDATFQAKSLKPYNNSITFYKRAIVLRHASRLNAE